MKHIDLKSAGRRGTLALACAVFLAAGIVLAAIGPALPYLAAHIERDLETLGWLFTAIAGGVVLAQFAAGPASDRLGQRLVLAAGMLLMGGGAGAIAFGASLASLLVGALLAGFGFGCVLAAGNMLVARLFAERSAAALNGVNLFFGVGSMLGPAIAGQASARFGLPQAGLWIGAALLLGLAPAVLAGNRASHSTPRAATRPGLPAHMGALWLIGVLLIFYTGTEVGFGAWVTVYMARSASLVPATAALVASAFWLALTVGRALGAVLGLRLEPQTLLWASLLGIVAGGGLLASGVGNLAQSVAGVVLLGLSCGPVFPTALSIVAAAAQGSGTATSLVLALANCGGLVLPALLGLLLNRYGPSSAATMVFAAALIMLALCAVIVRTGITSLALASSNSAQ